MDYKSKLNFEFEEFEALVGQERHPIFEKYDLVDEKLDSNDLDKRIEDFVIVVERLEDKRFFQFEYSRSNHHELNEGGLNSFPKTGYEVFPEVVTVTVYK